MQIRRQSWAIAALLLITFCWLGFVAVGFGALFKGLGRVNFPVATRFAVGYGPIAFPIFGIVAAAAIILSEVRGRNPWVQLALTALFVLLILWAVSGIFLGGSFMGPAIRTFRLDTSHRATASLFHAGRHWREYRGQTVLEGVREFDISLYE
jgi:ABC-type transport system involved in multi-copper enzyme maturation permease subunit